MTMTVSHFGTDQHFAHMYGTATADTDATAPHQLNQPIKHCTVEGTRPTSGNFTFTVQGSLDGTAWSTLATCTVTGGTSNFQFVVDKPVLWLRVVFTDVGAATVSWYVLGVP